MSPETRERILDGAAAAVARHGIAKLEMSDVSASSRVSRGTLYRYFPSRDALLTALASREGRLFKQRMLEAIEAAPPGPERMRVALEYATRHVQTHAALQRLLETDPALVLQGLREQFDGLKAEFGTVLGPLLRDVALVRRRVVTTEQLVDWLMRLMISAFLFPDREPGGMTEGLTAIYRILTTDLHDAAAARRRRPPVRPAPVPRKKKAVARRQGASR